MNALSAIMNQNSCQDNFNDNVYINIPKICIKMSKPQRYHLTCHDKNDVMTLHLNELIMLS